MKHKCVERMLLAYETRSCYCLRPTAPQWVSSFESQRPMMSQLSFHTDTICSELDLSGVSGSILFLSSCSIYDLTRVDRARYHYGKKIILRKWCYRLSQVLFMFLPHSLLMLSWINLKQHEGCSILYLTKISKYPNCTKKLFEMIILEIN